MNQENESHYGGQNSQQSVSHIYFNLLIFSIPEEGQSNLPEQWFLKKIDFNLRKNPESENNI